MSFPTLKRQWTRQMIELRIALVCACLALVLQIFAAMLTIVRVSGSESQYRYVVGLLLEVEYWLSPTWACQIEAGKYLQKPEQCLPAEQHKK